MDEPHAIIDEIEKVYGLLNEQLFSGKLKPVQIQIQPKKKVSLRYFPDNRVLAIGLDFTNLYPDAPGNEILAILLHEMIHISNHQMGLIDCTANQYHNKHFLHAALSVGFVVIKHKTQGWGITTTIYPRNVVERGYVRKPQNDVSEKLAKVFNSIKLDKRICKDTRVLIRSRLKEEKPTKTYFLKYVCNCLPPHNSIRSGRRPDGPNALNIHCMNCRSAFVCATEIEAEVSLDDE